MAIPFDVYSNPRLVEPKDVLASVYDYAVFFGGYAEDNVYQSFNNKAHLPQSYNSFCVVSLISRTPLSTNAKYMSPTDNEYTTYALTQYVIQIDVYANTKAECSQKMALMHIPFRDPIAVSFFGEKGLSALYAEDPKDMTGVDASGQYVSRYSMQARLAAWEAFAMDVQNFSTCDVDVINVDVRYTP